MTSARWKLVGGRSHFVWLDGPAWGERPQETYLQALARHRAQKPDAICLDFEGSEVTYAEIDDRSNRMANALARLGIGKGDRVASLLDNSEDEVLLFFAVNKLGGVWVPINTAYHGEFLRHQLADAETPLVVCENEYLRQVLDVAPHVLLIERVLVRDWDGSGEGPAALASIETIRGDDERAPGVTVAPGDIACLMYTSGTTGASKGCMLSHNYLCSIGRRRNRSVAPTPGGITWSSLPLSHIAALGTVLVANLLVGETASIASRFSVSGFWDEIERSGATSVTLLATALPLIAHMPDTPAMQRCHGQIRVLTGVPLSEADRKIWLERFGVGFVNTFAYGQTEANMVSLSPWGDPLPPLASMGMPSEDFDAMVAGEDGRPAAIDEPGELLLRPRQPGVMFSGYWKRPDATLQAMSDLWWHTGDIVRMDGKGYLYFVDRHKDHLRSRGENISSFEVESVMAQHPAVAEVAFHTVPAEPGHEAEIKATIVLGAGAAADEAELFEWARERLPYFAVPRYIEFRMGLPKTPVGKVQKNELRAMGKTEETWDASAAGYELRRRRTRASA